MTEPRPTPELLDYRSRSDDDSERLRDWQGWKKHTLFILVPTCALFRILVIAASFNQRTRGPSRYSMVTTDASRLCSAMERFGFEQGRYPNNLDELVPGYLETTSSITTWDYRPSEDRRRYTLTFDRVGETVTRRSDRTVVATTRTSP